MVTKGKAKYVFLDSTEKYNGEDTGKYTLTISLDDKEAQKLEDAGVKVRTVSSDDGDYKARKFSTKYPLAFDMIKSDDGEAIGSDFGAESDVEVLWKAGAEHPMHGVATYLTAIKVSNRTPGFKSSSEEASDFFG